MAAPTQAAQAPFRSGSSLPAVADKENEKQVKFEDQAGDEYYDEEADDGSEEEDLVDMANKGQISEKLKKKYDPVPEEAPPRARPVPEAKR